MTIHYSVDKSEFERIINVPQYPVNVKEDIIDRIETYPKKKLQLNWWYWYNAQFVSILRIWLNDSGERVKLISRESLLNYSFTPTNTEKIVKKAREVYLKDKDLIRGNPLYLDFIVDVSRGRILYEIRSGKILAHESFSISPPIHKAYMIQQLIIAGLGEIKMPFILSGKGRDALVDLFYVYVLSKKMITPATAMEDSYSAMVFMKLIKNAYELDGGDYNYIQVGTYLKPVFKGPVIERKEELEKITSEIYKIETKIQESSSNYRPTLTTLLEGNFKIYGDQVYLVDLDIVDPTWKVSKMEIAGNPTGGRVTAYVDPSVISNARIVEQISEAFNNNISIRSDKYVQ